MQRRPRQCRGQGGFTLVELLVVIVILGILSAVVVFAVRGSGDKGKEAAVATDERTIRTAQEVYCAQAGHYATEAQLTGAAPANDGVNTYKFLSEPSEYHAILPGDAGQGSCPGPGPTRYKLDCREPNCGLTLPPNGVPDPIPDPALATCGQPGGWCLAAPPSGSVDTFAPNNLVELETGKVLAIESNTSFTSGIATEIWDPAGGAAGQGAWSPGPSGAPPGTETNALVKLGGDLCAPSCGKVLVLFGGHPGHWELYDPTLNVFTPTSPGLFSRNHQASAAQIRGSVTQCGANCGKVLIVGNDSSGPAGPIKEEPTPPIAELFDPRSTTFSTAGYYADSANEIDQPEVAALSDGRVLLVGSQMVNGVRQAVAKLFDPLTGFFSATAPPSKSYRTREFNPPSVFADDSVLIGSELYRKGSEGGPDTWTPVTPCGDPSLSCNILASLPDGRVLANGNADSYRLSRPSKDMFLFDSKKATWSQTGSLISADSPGGGIYLTKSNKVLVVGQRSAELYTPPPP